MANETKNNSKKTNTTQKVSTQKVETKTTQKVTPKSETNIEKKVDTKSTNIEKSIDIQEILVQMQKQNELIVELQKQIDDSKQQNISKEELYQEIKDTEIFKEIPIETLTNDDDIEITNLCPNQFILSTEPFGNGKQFIFPQFGYTREIPYYELKQCLYANASFIESGRVYINDERVIKKHRLQEYYKTMLNYDDIINLTSLKPKELYEKLIKLPKAETNPLNNGFEPTQFDIIYSHLFEKIKNNELSDDQIYQIQKAYEVIRGEKIDLLDEAEYMNKVLKNEF